MNTEKPSVYSLNQIKDEMMGMIGTPKRDQYEFELKLDVLGEMIKRVRQERNLTQEQLGVLIGVQKAQISKLERSANNVTIATVLKVFKALKADISFKIALA